MGLLDDLKNQAEDLRAKEQQGEDQSGGKPQNYKKEIHPVMMDIYRFLKELTDNLNIVKPQTLILYPILPGGEKQPFQQRNYTLSVDDTQLIKNIKLMFMALLDKPITIRVKDEANIRKQTELLERFKVLHKRKDFNDKNYKLTHSDFIIQGPIKISVQFIGDPETSSIQIVFNNFEHPGEVKRKLDVTKINQDFLDKFGRYILREDDKLFALDISEKDKQAIREMVAKEKAKREQEIAEMERLAEDEVEKQKSSRGLRKFFHKNKD